MKDVNLDEIIELAKSTKYEFNEPNEVKDSRLRASAEKYLRDKGIQNASVEIIRGTK